MNDLTTTQLLQLSVLQQAGVLDDILTEAVWDVEQAKRVRENTRRLFHEAACTARDAMQRRLQHDDFEYDGDLHDGSLE